MDITYHVPDNPFAVIVNPCGQAQVIGQEEIIESDVVIGMTRDFAMAQEIAKAWEYAAPYIWCGEIVEAEPVELASLTEAAVLP